MISSKMAAAWVEAFYQQLSVSTLSDALVHAISTSGAPMRLYAQQPRDIDVRFSRMAASGMSEATIHN
jgi:hypothetical protein